MQSLGTPIIRFGTYNGSSSLHFRYPVGTLVPNEEKGAMMTAAMVHAADHKSDDRPDRV